MIRSMTGYGTAQQTDCGKKIVVEIKSVNHRYRDITVKTPRNYGYLEDAVKKSLIKYISRGKVDVYINIDNAEGAEGSVMLNPELAKGYYSALESLKQTLGIAEDIRIEHMTRFSDIFTVKKDDDDSDGICALAVKTAEEAAESFVGMKKTEGARLAEDMMAEMDVISGYVKDIEELSPKVVADYTKHMRDRMGEILGNHPVDEGRLLNEVAVFADKVNVNEEIVRLKSHIKQMKDMLVQDMPVGKKLDFVIQEMNREVNTIGSKSNDITIIKTVIDLKACIEKVREQVQNVE